MDSQRGFRTCGHPAKPIGWTVASLLTWSPGGLGIRSRFKTTTMHKSMTTISTSSTVVPFRCKRTKNLRWGAGWGTRRVQRRKQANLQKQRTPQNSMFYGVLRVPSQACVVIKYRRRGSNPHEELPSLDFESSASAIPPLRLVSHQALPRLTCSSILTISNQRLDELAETGSQNKDWKA